MPVYKVFTKQVIEHDYEIDIDLPVDMGESTSRLTDRMMRIAAENDAIIGQLTNVNVDDETVTYIYRDGQQIWPRLRKAKVATKASQIDFNAGED